MVSDETYDSCLPILGDPALDDETKTERLEDALRANSSLTGPLLSHAVLDLLWRHRAATSGGGSDSPPVRHVVVRRGSPAPWQAQRPSTSLSSYSATTASPVSSAARLNHGTGGSSNAPRAPRSSTASPFSSPRPSPRMAFAQPVPQSPSTAYDFADYYSPVPDLYTSADIGSDPFDYYIGEDAVSTTSSTGLSPAAPEWPPQPDQNPFDMLRSVLGDSRRSNDEIEEALEAHGYDLAATIISLTGAGTAGNDSPRTKGVLVGKSMAVDSNARPLTPTGPARSHVVCKYYLSTGACLRADCRFSHDLTSHVCKYWLMGNCLAGASCPFSHDPVSVIGSLNLNSNENQSDQGYQDSQEAFPSLGENARKGVNPGYFRTRSSLGTRPSRPTSRHQNRDINPAAPSVDDPDAFPTLSSIKQAKKHAKRAGHKDVPGLDPARLSPSPATGPRRVAVPKLSRSPASFNSSTSNNANPAAQALPQPMHIPWLETGPRANQQYLKHRLDAITHGNVRNKFLQSAAQAWNRNDARAAKALSLRGQAENEAMRRSHREAARHLYGSGGAAAIAEAMNNNNSIPSDIPDEVYVDLHGLHPTEAIDYLAPILATHARAGRHLLYAVTGTGHHSKNGKDKVGKAVKAWLADRRFVWRDFIVPGERGGYVGGVLGIDPTSGEAAGTQGPRASDGGGKGETEGGEEGAALRAEAAEAQAEAEEEAAAEVEADDEEEEEVQGVGEREEESGAPASPKSIPIGPAVPTIPTGPRVQLLRRA